MRPERRRIRNPSLMRCARCRRAEVVALGRLAREADGRLGAPEDWTCERCGVRTPVEFARRGESVT